ncbi:rhomboid family protein [Chryseobacterium sp. HMWF028]|nr:rhomboid family protein [Chryseobacterium sp. HMWF028]
MSELLILGFIIALILLFFNREWIKNRFFPDQQKNYTIDDKFNSDKRDREKEIDRLLSKMGKNGINDLSEKDRKKLDELSKM